MTCCPIFEQFNEEQLLIKEYEHWKLLAHKAPRTLGSCVVITKAHHPRFNDLQEEEMQELLVVVEELEGALAKLWAFDNINWLMLMMKDKHTHFHVFPRYDGEREFDGRVWKESEPNPDPLNLQKVDCTLRELQAIRDAISAQIIK